MLPPPDDTSVAEPRLLTPAVESPRPVTSGTQPAAAVEDPQERRRLLLYGILTRNAGKQLHIQQS